MPDCDAALRDGLDKLKTIEAERVRVAKLCDVVSNLLDESPAAQYLSALNQMQGRRKTGNVLGRTSNSAISGTRFLADFIKHMAADDETEIVDDDAEEDQDHEYDVNEGVGLDHEEEEENDLFAGAF